jgi:hypothetical protein
MGPKWYISGLSKRKDQKLSSHCWDFNLTNSIKDKMIQQII